MTKQLKAVLGCMALLFVLAIVGAHHFDSSNLWAALAARVVAGSLFIAGTVTITYAYPVSGATAPTAAQMARKNMLTLTIAMADGDTTATIAHNWNLSTAQLNNRFPWITWNYVVAGTAPVFLTFTRGATNVVVTKATGSGTGGTYEFTLERPHSIIQ